MTQGIKTRRFCSGLYTVTSTSFAGVEVQVIRRDKREGSSSNGWQAIAQWDRYLYTDLVETKGEAMKHAKAMVEGFEKRLKATMESYYA